MNDDAELIDAILAGDREAFRLLVHRYERPVFAFVRNMIANACDREDIAQEVFLAAFTGLHSYDRRRSSLVTWLLTIARNRCLNHLKRRVAVVGVDAPEPTGPRTPQAILMERELFDRLDEALAALPLEQRTAFVLAEMNSLSYAEIAAIECVELGTVKSRIGRAREKLRLVLQEHVKGEASI